MFGRLSSAAASGAANSASAESVSVSVRMVIPQGMGSMRRIGRMGPISPIGPIRPITRQLSESGCSRLRLRVYPRLAVRAAQQLVRLVIAYDLLLRRVPLQGAPQLHRQ